jgi:hypothetical protein
VKKIAATFCTTGRNPAFFRIFRFPTSASLFFPIHKKTVAGLFVFVSASSAINEGIEEYFR